MNSEESAPGYIVIDASVSLKWALDDEEDIRAATALRDDGLRGRFQMLAPSLWLYEITNGLLNAVRRGRLPSSLASGALSHIERLGVRLVDPETGACFAVAQRYQIAAYDAAYLALAEALGAMLWTGDRNFLQAVVARTDLVNWIGDYSRGSSTATPI